jgi:hypothetical protein
LEESLNGTTDSLDVPGRLVAMCLVVWAASFGNDEEGKLDQSSDPKDWRLSVKSRTNNMVKELLYLIDSYGIIRKPTWDGLVVLLTILPLTKGEVTSMQEFRISLTRRLVEIISDFERAVWYFVVGSVGGIQRLKTTLDLAQTNHERGGSPCPGFQAYHVPRRESEEGSSPFSENILVVRDSGLDGAFSFSGEDGPVSGEWYLQHFYQRVFRTTNYLYSLESLLPPLSPPADGSPAEKDSIRNFTALRQYFSIPLKLASAYRLVQRIISNPEFVRGNIDETRLTKAWSTLDAIWGTLKTPGAEKLPRAGHSEYSKIWKLFIFECCRSQLFLISFVTIRDPASLDNHLDIALNQTMAIQPERSLQLFRACNTAHSKCRALLGTVIADLKALSGTSLGQYDTCGLSKPIYSVAAFIARSPKVGTKGDFLVCLNVLQQTRWVYSDHEKKVADLRFLWNASREEPLDEPPESPEPPSSPDILALLRGYTAPPPNFVPSPPFSPTFLPSTPAKSARSRGSSGGSFCISEGHNSPEDDVPSRKSPTKLARVLAILEKKNPSSRRKQEM